MEHLTAYTDGDTAQGDPPGQGTLGTPGPRVAQVEQGTPPGAIGTPPGVVHTDTSSDGEPLPPGQFYGAPRTVEPSSPESPKLNSHIYKRKLEKYLSAQELRNFRTT